MIASFEKIELYEINYEPMEVIPHSDTKRDFQFLQSSDNLPSALKM